MVDSYCHTCEGSSSLELVTSPVSECSRKAVVPRKRQGPHVRARVCSFMQYRCSPFLPFGLWVGLADISGLPSVIPVAGMGYVYALKLQTAFMLPAFLYL